MQPPSFAAHKVKCAGGSHALVHWPAARLDIGRLAVRGLRGLFRVGGGTEGQGHDRLARDDLAGLVRSVDAHRRRSPRSACSTRSTTRWCAPIPARRWGRASPKSWTESEDGLTYEFKLRPNLNFHNGDPLTTEDVKFSFDRYKGAGAKTLKEHVKEVEIVDPRVVRFHLKEPWPDFMTFYGTTATAAGIVVPKKYIDRGRRRRLQEASDRRRPLQIRQHQARHRGRARGLSRTIGGACRT